MRFLNKPITGSRYSYISQLVKQYGIDTSHFSYSKVHKVTESYKRKAPEEILVLITDEYAHRAKATMLTRAMVELGVKYECSTCSVSEWQGEPLVLDVDHIDGNRFDCRLHNLRFLCPNCHRQTTTFAKRKVMTPAEEFLCGCGKPKARRSKSCASCHHGQQS
jgi:hypothetical protein